MTRLNGHGAIYVETSFDMKIRLKVVSVERGIIIILAFHWPVMGQDY